MKFIDCNTIKLDKELNKLDRFVLNFVKVLEKYSEYVLVSGYVSILFGRSRMSEDIDVLIPKPIDLMALTTELELNGFICINTDDTKEMNDLLMDSHSIRFAEKGRSIPNIEVRLADNRFSKLALAGRIKVLIGKESLYISPIELQIAFKRVILGSEKDNGTPSTLKLFLKTISTIN